MYQIVLKKFLYLTVSIITSSCSEKDELPKINDIFKSLSEDTPEPGPDASPPGAVVRNIDINLETLNMSTFIGKIEGYSKALSGNVTEDNPLVKEYNSRRLAWIGSWRDWSWASKLLAQTKIYDLMLQTIYMARYKIRQIENDPYYNPGDTSYRIAFLYRNLLRINRRVQDAYMTMKKNKVYSRWPVAGGRWPLSRFLVLHHKVCRLHVDFLYLWWVMVRLNERYEYRHGLPNTTPEEDKYYYTTRPTKAG